MSSYYFVGTTGTGGSTGFNPGGSNSQTGPFFDVSSGAAPTALGAGYIIGPATTSGVSVVYAGPQVLQFMNGNQTANASLRANSFQTTLNDGSVEYGNQGATTGMATSTTSVALVANSITGLSINNSGQTTTFRRFPTSKAASYTVLTTDTGTVFDNTGAGGTVVNFTLPTAALGLTYTFNSVLVTAAAQITVTPGASDKIAYLGKAVAVASSGPVGNGTTTGQASITLVCTAANTWTPTNLVGTWT